MSKEYEALLKKRADELEKNLPPIRPRKLDGEIKAVYGKVSDEFFKPENWLWVAGFFQGDGFTGYIHSPTKKGIYYAMIGLVQHKVGIRAVEEVARLWYTTIHKHNRDCVGIRKHGKIVSNTILPTLLPRLYTPKKEEAEFIIKHGSPVTIETRNEYLRTMPATKGRKAVIKGTQEAWLDVAMTVTPSELAYGVPNVLYLDEDTVKELEYVEKE